MKHRTVGALYTQMCNNESLPRNHQFPGISFYFLSCLFSYSVYLSFPRFSVCAKFCPPPPIPSLRSHVVFSDSFISPSLYSSSHLSRKKERKRGNMPAESCWVILCRRETSCRRSNNAHLLLNECAPSVCFPPAASFHPLHSLNLSLSPPLLHLLLGSFCIFSQPWR